MKKPVTTTETTSEVISESTREISRTETVISPDDLAFIDFRRSDEELAKTALVVVDPQPTFMPGGELPIAGGDSIVPVLIAFINKYGAKLGLIVFSRDWHPAHHFSFTEQGGPWPSHGVNKTPNAQVHPDLIAACKAAGLPYIIISKGMHPQIEAYSAYDGWNLETAKSLEVTLKEAGIIHVIFAGLAGDICVKATVEAGAKVTREDGEAAYDLMYLLTDATGFLDASIDPAQMLADLPILTLTSTEF